MSGNTLYEQHAQEVTVLRSLLQGIAASAIAFAIHETASRQFQWSLVPIAMAVIAWAISFSAGVVHSHARQRGLVQNIALNIAEQLGDKGRIDGSKTGHRDASDKAQRAYSVQQWALLAGAVLYVGGHGLHIWENSAAHRYVISPMVPPASPSRE